MVRFYRHDSDYEDFRNWHEAWGLTAPTKELLPTVGFVVEGQAMGFLYQTDSKIGFFENYIANPEADRNKALDLITEALTHTAQERGLRLVIAVTAVDAVAKRAQNHGFENTEKSYNMLYKRIN